MIMNTLKKLLSVFVVTTSLSVSTSFAQDKAAAKPEIPGYAMGSRKLSRSPVSLTELESLKKTLLLGDDDIKAERVNEFETPQSLN
jgi:hypothetical protein